MSLIINGDGSARPVVICECGEAMGMMHTPFPHMTGWSCDKCGRTRITNVEMAEFIMNAVIQKMGPPPHLVTFEHGLPSALTGR